MDIALVNKIKRLAIIALASDDELIEAIVLKGGNAIELTHPKAGSKLSRTSYDLDFSIEEGDFSEDEASISERIQKTLQKTFLEHGFVVIDFKFGAKPKTPNAATADFWGGYLATFKVIEEKAYAQKDINTQRRNAIALRPNQSTVFELEFSKFEYIGQKTAIKVDGYTIYVYTPEMIVFEKVRAICQQLPQYADILPSHHPRARARDFYDIYLIMDQHKIDPNIAANKELITHIFAAKKVPLDFIRYIRDHQGIHHDNWNDVQHTVDPTEELAPFDFYFSFVVNQFESLTFP